jgi:hypothetical protein
MISLGEFVVKRYVNIKVVGISRIINHMYLKFYCYIIYNNMVIKNEIIYPVFLECCQYAEDTFWINIFEDLAYGKTPYGTYINKDFLCCSYKKKEFSYKIERKDPKILYTDIYNLLTKKLGILSKKEKVRKRVNFHETESRIKKYHQDWSNIRKKNIKDLLIERYVIDMKHKYELSIKQTKYLSSVIFIAMIFKVIGPKDIEYSNGKIQNISGIEYTKNKIIIKRNIYNISVDFTPEILINKKVMSDNWGKYIESLKKKKVTI